MKKIWVCSLLFLVCMPSLAQTSTIKVDVDRQIGQIDPLIYSNFTEHLGHCVYQGIYDPSSPRSDQDGFRTIANSKDVESYHSLSHNSRWMVLLAKNFGFNILVCFLQCSSASMILQD